jgi:hypothetical protein
MHDGGCGGSGGDVGSGGGGGGTKIMHYKSLHD